VDIPRDCINEGDVNGLEMVPLEAGKCGQFVEQVVLVETSRHIERISGFGDMVRGHICSAIVDIQFKQGCHGPVIARCRNIEFFTHEFLLLQAGGVPADRLNGRRMQSIGNHRDEMGAEGGVIRFGARADKVAFGSRAILQIQA